MGVFEEIIAPIIGAILANVMFFSPLPAVLKVRETQILGELNPLPFPVITANCVSWLLYSVSLQNYPLLFGNLPGAMIGIFYSLTTIVYAPQRIRDLMTAFMLIFPAVFVVYMFTLAALDADEDTIQFVIGLVTNILLVIYYAAPLSVFYKVIKTRDSSSLYFPLVVANTVNGVMQFVYGLFALEDPFVWVGNGVGTVLNLVSVLLIFVYPNKENKNSGQFLRWVSSNKSGRQVPIDSERSTIQINEIVRQPSDESIDGNEDSADDLNDTSIELQDVKL